MHELLREDGGHRRRDGLLLVRERQAKEVAADRVGGAAVRKAHAVDYTNHSLGSFLGPMDYDRDEAPSKGFSGSSSTFKYLKTISDYSQVDEAGVYPCAKLIERICEKLSLPPGVDGAGDSRGQGAPRDQEAEDRVHDSRDLRLLDNKRLQDLRRLERRREGGRRSPQGAGRTTSGRPRSSRWGSTPR